MAAATRSDTERNNVPTRRRRRRRVSFRNPYPANPVVVTELTTPTNAKIEMASLIIVNKDDRGIVDTLNSLSTLSSPIDFEVIVVDASAGSLDDIRDNFPSVRWFSLQPKANKRTIAEQRNVGIKHSQGEVVIFLDAHCIPSAHWLDRLLYPIMEEGEDLVAGPVTSTAGSSVYDSPASESDKRYLDEAPTINLAVRKDVLRTVGPFDETIGFAEDIDFSWRATDRGYRIRQVSQATVIHYWGNVREDLRRTYRYGIGRAQLYKKHPNRWPNLFRDDSHALVYPAYLAGLPLTLVFWPYPLLLLIPLVVNKDSRPIHTVGHHLVYGLGVLRGLRRS